VPGYRRDQVAYVSLPLNPDVSWYRLPPFRSAEKIAQFSEVGPTAQLKVSRSPNGENAPIWQLEYPVGSSYHRSTSYGLTITIVPIPR